MQGAKPYMQAANCLLKAFALIGSYSLSYKKPKEIATDKQALP